MVSSNKAFAGHCNVSEHDKQDVPSSAEWNDTLVLKSLPPCQLDAQAQPSALFGERKGAGFQTFSMFMDAWKEQLTRSVSQQM